MRNVRCVALVLLSLTWPAAARADSGAGPRVWTEPTEPPSLRSPLSEKDYADQLAAQMARTDPAQVGDQTPWAGVEVTGVDPKSQAKSLGVKVGDVLVTSNGEQIHTIDEWGEHRDANDATATVWSSASGLRTLTLAPGLLGVDLKPYLHPEALYVRDHVSNGKPDPMLFAAAACAQPFPNLARTVLAHLRSGGNQDDFVYFVDAIAASQAGNFDDSIASGMWAMRTASDEQKQVLAPLMRAAALASFNLNLAVKIEKDFPKLKLINQIDDETGKDYTVDLPKTLGQCDAIKWVGPASCADAFAELKPTDQTANMANAGKAGAGGISAANSIKKSGHAQFDAPENQYNLFALGPPAANVKFSLRCRFTPNAKKANAYAGKTVKFGVSLKGSEVMPITMFLDPDGVVDIAGTNIPEFSYHLAAAYTVGQPFDVTLVVVGNRCEIDIAGTRAFYGPILENEHKRKLCFLFQAVGVKGQINRVKWETAAAGE